MVKLSLTTKCFSFAAGGEASCVALSWRFQQAILVPLCGWVVLAPHGTLALASLD